MPKIPKSDRLPPIHPGAILHDEFMVPLGISANKLAIELHVPVTRIGEIVNERRGITADTALRLARYFGNSPEFWMNLQQHYELKIASRAEGDSIREKVHPRDTAAA